MILERFRAGLDAQAEFFRSGCADLGLEPMQAVKLGWTAIPAGEGWQMRTIESLHREGRLRQLERRFRERP